MLNYSTLAPVSSQALRCAVYRQRFSKGFAPVQCGNEHSRLQNGSGADLLKEADTDYPHVSGTGDIASCFVNL